eukprot:EG_transcript_6494
MPALVSSRFVNQPIVSPRLSARAEEADPSFAPSLWSGRSSPGDGLDLVVAVPADAVAPVVEGSVVADPCRTALALLREHLRPFAVVHTQARRFAVEDKLGEGQSSVVVQVEDPAEPYFEDRHVALKVVPLAGAYVEEVHATAALLKRLNHDLIVPCLDTFDCATGGVSCLCLKLPLCRHSLADVIRWKSCSGSQISARSVVIYISQLATALQYLHEQGLLHGDLRPEHVLLHQYRKEVRVIGLADSVGLRRRSAGAASVTGGRLLAVPPEWAHSSFLGRRLHPQEVPLPSYDMWTLGCLLVELCTGKTLEARLGPHGPPLAVNLPVMEEVRQQVQTAHKGLFAPLARGLLDPDPDTRLDPEGVQEALREVKTKLADTLTSKLSKPFKLLKSSIRA